MGERIGGAECEESGKKIGFTQIPQMMSFTNYTDLTDKDLL